MPTFTVRDWARDGVTAYAVGSVAAGVRPLPNSADFKRAGGGATGADDDVAGQGCGDLPGAGQAHGADPGQDDMVRAWYRATAAHWSLVSMRGE